MSVVDGPVLDLPEGRLESGGFLALKAAKRRGGLGAMIRRPDQAALTGSRHSLHTIVNIQGLPIMLILMHSWDVMLII